MKISDRAFKVLEVAGILATIITFVLTLRSHIFAPDSYVGRLLFNYPVTLGTVFCALLSIAIAVFILVRTKASVLMNGVRLPYYNKRFRGWAILILSFVPIISLFIGSWSLIRETPDLLFPPFKIVNLKNGNTEICFGIANTGKSEGILIEHIQFDYIEPRWGPSMPSTFSVNTGENCTYMNSVNYPVESLNVPLTKILSFARITKFSEAPLIIAPGQARYFQIKFSREYSQPVQVRMRIQYFDIQRGHVEYITPFVFHV